MIVSWVHGVQRLLVATVREEGLRYVGELGSGWSPQARLALARRRASRRRTRSLVPLCGVLSRAGAVFPPRLDRREEVGKRFKPRRLVRKMACGIKKNSSPAGLEADRPAR